VTARPALQRGCEGKERSEQAEREKRKERKCRGRSTNSEAGYSLNKDLQWGKRVGGDGRRTAVGGESGGGGRGKTHCSRAKIMQANECGCFAVHTNSYQEGQEGGRGGLEASCNQASVSMLMDMICSSDFPASRGMLGKCQRLERCEPSHQRSRTQRCFGLQTYRVT
jgi:hypothetical protein